MKLNKNQVKHVAKLANLPLTEQEEEKYTSQLSKLLEYVDHLNQVDTENIEPTFNVTGLSNVMDQDIVKLSLTQDQALQNAPAKKDGFFVTKGIFNE